MLGRRGSHHHLPCYFAQLVRRLVPQAIQKSVREEDAWFSLVEVRKAWKDAGDGICHKPLVNPCFGLSGWVLSLFSFPSKKTSCTGLAKLLFSKMQRTHLRGTTNDREVRTNVASDRMNPSLPKVFFSQETCETTNLCDISHHLNNQARNKTMAYLLLEGDNEERREPEQRCEPEDSLLVFRYCATPKVTVGQRPLRHCTKGLFLCPGSLFSFLWHRPFG